MDDKKDPIDKAQDAVSDAADAVNDAKDKQSEGAKTEVNVTITEDKDKELVEEKK